MATVTIPLSNPGVAGFAEGNEYTQVEVFYGEKTPLTRTFENGHTAELPIYSVVKLDANGAFVPAVAGDKAFGVTSTVSAPGDKIDLYNEAYFNTDALAWDESFDTEDKKRAAFIGVPGLYADRIPTHGRSITARTIPA